MERQIQPSDLILYLATGRDEFITRAVGAFQLLLGAGKRPVTYSHVAIAAWTQGRQYESKWPFSGLYNIDQTRSYEVWRLKGITPEKQGAILRACADVVHGPLWDRIYPLDTLLTFGLITHKHAAVCSQWAAARCRNGGYRFGREGFPIVSPDVMPDSGLIEFVKKGGRA